MINSTGEKYLRESLGVAADLLHVNAAPPFTLVDTGSSGTWDVGGDGEPEEERRTTAER
jgi:hypothetical protein